MVGVATLALLLAATQAKAAMFFTTSWSGVEIAGGIANDPGFMPEGTATFDVTGDVLTVKLEYTGVAGGRERVDNNGKVLTGLTWDMPGFAGTLTPEKPEGAVAHKLVTIDGAGVASWSAPNVDVSDNWAYKTNISAATGFSPYGVGAIGDIAGGIDSFGHYDIIGTPDGNQPNGVDYGILPTKSDVAYDLDGLASNDPFAESWVTFKFTGATGLTTIAGVKPLFGSEGRPILPEPSAVVVWSLLGFFGIAVSSYRRRRKA